MVEQKKNQKILMLLSVLHI